tara:strand:+ start:196 stop:930 length:735 start_codon:yes stop_codon:yes gene_type:complete
MSVLLISCSSKRQINYLQNVDGFSNSAISTTKLNEIEIGDILKIDIQSVISEAGIPYNRINKSTYAQNINLLKVDGYLVDNEYLINLPVIGKVNVKSKTVKSLETHITELLLSKNHLSNPSVKVVKVNSKFTILGEVKNPGTFSYFDENLNILQAIGYAGDLTINGKRDNIIIVRETGGVRTISELSLKDKDLIKSNLYNVKNNDVIIVSPNYSKVKSAGFIGSANSIASISSLIVSLALLFLN